MTQNQKRTVLICVMSIFLLPVFAHSPLLIIEDSDEEFVYVKAGFSNGQDASGMTLIVKSKFDDRIIETVRFPETSSVSIKIPAEPYYLVFDGGPGHTIAKNGPAPASGFTVHPDAADKPIPGQGIPLWLLITGIAAIIVLLVFTLPKFLKKT